MIREELWQHCYRLIQQQDWLEVTAQVASLSTQDALSQEGCELRAYLATRQGDLLAAELALRQGLQLAPDCNNQLLLASNLHKQQRFCEAEALLVALLRAYPDAQVAHFNLAQSYLARKQWLAALPELACCLQQQPGNGELLFQLATVHCQLDQHERATGYLEQLLAIEPHHVEALNNLGVCHLKANNSLRAIQCFATAMRVDEQHLPALSNLAVTLYKEKRFSEALVYFEQYLALAPLDMEANYQAGVVALMLVLFSKASAYFHAVLAQNKTNVPSMLNLAAIALKKQEPSNALAWYQRILSVEPQQAIAKYMVAALLCKNDCAKAPEDYVEALFDQYAAHFDQHLLQDLAYQTPEQLRKLYDRLPKQARRTGSLLDLGCGTGLSARVFKDVASYMIGVDLSAQMLKEAAAKQLYQSLVKAEIVDYLKTCDQAFELIIAADVLVYIGDLTELLRLITAHLAPQGIVLLSLEIATAKQQAPYVLTSTGRFQHQLSYVHQLAKECQLSVLHEQTVVLRSQAGQTVSGQIIALQAKA